MPPIDAKLSFLLAAGRRPSLRFVVFLPPRAKPWCLGAAPRPRLLPRRLEHAGMQRSVASSSSSSSTPAGARQGRRRPPRLQHVAVVPDLDLLHQHPHREHRIYPLYLSRRRSPSVAAACRTPARPAWTSAWAGKEASWLGHQPGLAPSLGRPRGWQPQAHPRPGPGLGRQ